MWEHCRKRDTGRNLNLLGLLQAVEASVEKNCPHKTKAHFAGLLASKENALQFMHFCTLGSLLIPNPDSSPTNSTAASRQRLLLIMLRLPKERKQEGPPTIDMCWLWRACDFMFGRLSLSARPTPSKPHWGRTFGIRSQQHNI